MFSKLRKFLVIVLMMLQFIAPLVHAHASEHCLKLGLHVPGLEHYGDAHATTLAQIPQHVCADGMIVGVETGLEQNGTTSQADSDSNYFLHQRAFAFAATVFRFDANFSAQPQHLVYRTFITSYPPRAPPAQ